MELPQDWGNRLLEGTNKTLCALGARRKGQRSHKRLIQACPLVSGSLWQRRGSTMACHSIRDTESNSAGISHFEGSLHYRHYPYHNLTSSQTTGREHSSPHQQKIGLKIY